MLHFLSVVPAGHQDLATEFAPWLRQDNPAQGCSVQFQQVSFEGSIQRSELRSMNVRASAPFNLRFDFALTPALGRGVTKPPRPATAPGALRA